MRAREVFQEDLLLQGGRPRIGNHRIVVVLLVWVRAHAKNGILGPWHENQFQVWLATQELPQDCEQEVCMQAPPDLPNIAARQPKSFDADPELSPLVDLVQNDVGDPCQ